MSSLSAVPTKGYDQRIIRQQQSTETPRDWRVCSVEAARYHLTQGDYPKSQQRVFNKPTPPTPIAGTDIAVDMMKRAQALAALPNVSFICATDLNIIKEDIMSMDPKESSKPIELSEMAKKAIATAIGELEMGSCKTFSNIDELFDDLESD